MEIIPVQNINLNNLIMTDSTTPITTLFDRAEDYGKTTLNLMKLNAIDKSADVLSTLVSRVVVLMIVVFSVLIISVGLSLWVGKLLGENFYGFFVIGGFYAIVAIVIYLYRLHWLQYPISNAIIKQMLNPKKNEK
jgi:hypothetical protein